MPYTTTAPVLPFTGSTQQSRHASYLGAKDAESRAPTQTDRYLELLRRHGGRTDLEAARVLDMRLASLIARRAPLVKKGIVIPDGFKENPETGLRNVIWRLREP